MSEASKKVLRELVEKLTDPEVPRSVISDVRWAFNETRNKTAHHATKTVRGTAIVHLAR